ncbi:unnamed protein product [Effrenium voratum]|nr:unnamed protein product [Effrenium voratum]
MPAATARKRRDGTLEQALTKQTEETGPLGRGASDVGGTVECTAHGQHGQLWNPNAASTGRLPYRMARLILFLLRPAWAERLPARLFEGSKEPELPQLPDCEGGVLRLGSGQYRVAEEGAQWSSPCALEADGAQILLDGPLLAEGNLTLRGSLHFTGRNSFFQACVHVGGDLQVHGAMSVSNCSNLRKVRKDNTRDGGCVRAWRLEILPTGRLELRNCSAARAGGGLYVGGGGLDQDGALSIFDGAAHMAGCAAVTGLWRHSGSTKMSNCSARGAGGGALAKSGLQLRGGEMQLADCRAEGEGGCLMVLEGVNQTGGALHIFRGRGVGLGGCASVAGGLRLSRAGRLVFRDCAVEDAPKLPEKYAGNGGALYLSGNLDRRGIWSLRAAAPPTLGWEDA